LETAKGALDTVLSLLQQQKNLAVKSSDDSLTDNERGFLDQEFQAIVSEIDRISDNANFNGKTLLDGSIGGVSTVATQTGLSAENYGIISAGATELKGTVESGDLTTTESEKGVNRIAIATNDTADGAGTLVVTNGLASGEGDLTATVNFTFGSDIDATIDNIVTAFNSFSGTNAAVAQNFELVNNGDNSFSINAKEAGTQFDDFTFQLTDAANNLVATMGMDAAGQDVDDNGGGALAFNTDTAITGTDTAIGVDGTFYTKAAYNVGDSRTSSELSIAGFTATDDDVIRLTLTDAAGRFATAGNDVTIDFTQNTAGATVEEIIDSLIEVVNGGVTSASDLTASATIDGLTIGGTASAAERAQIFSSFVIEKTSASTAKITAAETGIANDYFDFQLSNTTAAARLGTVTLGGQDADANGGGDVQFAGGTTLSAGSVRATSTTEATIDYDLLGGFSNFKATFNEAATGYRNSVSFSVEVNGTTYVSDPVYLFGGATESDLGQQGNQIAANQEIVFYDPDGPKTTDGDLTDNAFVLRNGSSAITLTDMTDAAKARESLDTIVGAFETQLASTNINQSRSLNLDQINASSGDHRITAAVGTILEGIAGFDSVGTNVASYNEGDIRLLSSDYSSAGAIGDIGTFSVDRLTNRITTEVNGEVYTAYLSADDLPSIGNVSAFGTNLDGTSNVGAYNATTKVLDLQDGTTSAAATSVTGTAKLHFFSENTTDGRVLEIDLGNVAENTAQINIDSSEGEEALASALNSVFGVASNESLSFQVGAASSDTIGVSIGSAKTTSIYKNNDGTVETVSVETKENAIAAGNVLDNAINSVVSLISDISAKITSFNSAIQNNQASIQNADAARSKLLDTDYTQESTRFAESRVRVDAATAVLTQVNARIQNLLQLLQQ
jgi:flagellin